MYVNDHHVTCFLYFTGFISVPMDVECSAKHVVHQFLQDGFESLVRHDVESVLMQNCDTTVENIDGDNVVEHTLKNIKESVIISGFGEAVNDNNHTEDIIGRINDANFQNQNINNNFLAYNSFKDFEKAFREYQKETLTTFCTAHNTRDFAKDGKYVC